MAEAPAFRSRIVGWADVPLDGVLANPDNWRIHPRDQQVALEESLDTLGGWVRGVIINTITDHLIDGHLRALVADRRGEETIPALLVEVDPAEEKPLILAFDAIGDLAIVELPRLERLLGLTTFGAATRALLESYLPSATAERRPTPLPDGSAPPTDYATSVIYRLVLPYPAGAAAEAVWDALDAQIVALGLDNYNDVVTTLLRRKFGSEHADG